MSEKKVRAHVIVSGIVQGVFFRAETMKAAHEYGVCGWVRNKSDGTVEAVFEGNENDVVSALEWCKKGSPRSNVTGVNVKWEDYQGEFSRFDVTF